MTDQEEFYAEIAEETEPLRKHAKSKGHKVHRGRPFWWGGPTEGEGEGPVGGGDQAILSMRSFFAPLVTSLTPTIGIGLSSFTRATGATLEDWEQNLCQAVPGEARFQGARRVQNLLPNSGFLIGGNPPTSWSLIASGGTIAVNQSLADPLYNQVTCSVVNNREILAYAADLIAGHTYRLSCFCEDKTGGPFVDTSLHMVPTTATISGVVAVLTSSFTPGKRMTGPLVLCTVSGQATFRVGLGCGSTETGTGSISISRPQLEDVTGQSNQNPATFVSTGVAAFPYHGAGVDGVRYFSHQNGNTFSGTGVLTEVFGASLSSSIVKGYFPEGARTNLCLQSEDFTSASWTAAAVDTTPTGNNAVAPDGNTTADLLTEGVAGTAAETQVIIATADVNYSVTRWVKRGNTDWIFMAVFNGANVVRAWFNLNTGIKGTLAAGGTGAAVSSTQVAYPNGWYRCSVAGSVGSGATNISFATASASADNNVTRVNNSTRLEWGAGFEVAAFPSSYIPTTTVAVTRNADSLIYPDAGNASIAVGSFYAEAASEWASVGTTSIMAALGDSNGRLAYCNAFSTAIVTFDGTTVTSANSGDFATGTRKVASSWGPAGLKMAALSPMGSVAFDGAMGIAGSGIGIGINPLGGSQWFGTIKNVQIWSRQLPDAILQSLTT